MDSFNWDDPLSGLDMVTSSPNKVPLPHENFDQYFEEYQEMDNLFNETLTGLQELDVPTGFDDRKHTRKVSGTAIFGFDKDLSLGLPKSISPGELLGMEPDKILLSEADEESHGYAVSSDNPKAYRFPASPSPSPSRNNYSARYLQDLGSRNQISYVDDIEPLLKDDRRERRDIRSDGYRYEYGQRLSEPYSATMAQTQSGMGNGTGNGTGTRMGNGTGTGTTSGNPTGSGDLDDPAMYGSLPYVPIPVQQPTYRRRTPLSSPVRPTRNTFLPPPSPPTLSHGSPEWSSPEPQSPAARLQSSPIRNSNGPNFYHPQFFSEDNFFSHPSSSPLNSSPVARTPRQDRAHNVHSYVQPAGPVGPVGPAGSVGPGNDDTVEMNSTLQLTPLKNTLPNTPSRSQVQLEWSPIISPSAKASQDVRRHIKESSARRRVKKTSLLPPGELDRYWEGPDADKTYTCTYKNCGKKFTRRYNVRSHIQTHLSDRPFGCPHCPKRFVRQHDLNRHVKGHMETTHCRCVCGKEFTRLDALKKHQLRNICIGGRGISKP